jgi:archaellum component FlaC
MGHYDYERNTTTASAMGNKNSIKSLKETVRELEERIEKLENEVETINE